MASIKKRSGSPYWIACYRKANGERTQQSTKQTDRGKAWEICLGWEAAERKAIQGALTEAKAREVISEMVERTTGTPLQFYTAESWLNDWLDGKRQTASEGTSTRYSHVVKDFIAHLGNRAKLNIAYITPRDIKVFRDAELKVGKSGKTCNLAIKTINVAFNAARRQGLIQFNPVEALESLHHQTPEKGRFTQEQIGSLIKAADADRWKSSNWRGVILFGYFTGARLRDITNMRWSSIDLEKKIISYTPIKRRRSKIVITVPIHPELEDDLITMAGQDNPNAFLFPLLAGRKTGGAHGLSNTFAAIMKEAGIESSEARPRKGKGRAISSLSFHSLRHGFNSAMANHGVMQEIRQKLTGHASSEMNDKYTHHEIEPLRKAVNVIPSLKATNTLQ